jgi:monoterpene epsilon-lactone hydrolase
VTPFIRLIGGVRAAVTLRRRVSGPLRPSWDPTFEALAELFHQGSLRITRLSIEAQRRSTQSVMLGLPSSPLYKETIFEKVSAGGVPAEWFRREDAEGGPLVLYLHGGGFGLGTIDTHSDLIARIARSSRANALALEYRLAPEHRFPAQLDDALAAYRWLLEQGVSPKRLVVSGDSAGGGLAIALMVKLRAAGEPLPAAAALLSPWVDLEGLGSTIDENHRYDYISRRALAQYRKRFVDDENVRHPHAAPLYADLRDLPPMLIQAGSAEVLLDDSRRITERARAAGVNVTFRVWEDMIHVWQLFAFLIPQGAAAIEEIGSFIREHVPREG